MRTVHLYQILFFCGIFTFSCNSFLDVVPDNVATIDIAFNSRVNAERFFYTLYGYLPAHASNSNPGLIAGDEIWTNDVTGRNWGGLNIAKGDQRITDPYLDYWSDEDMFVAIRDCNIFLENIDQPRDLEPFEKERWIAEAKFLKAYFHFWLMRMYGPVPIIRENISVSGDVNEVRRSRDPVDEVVDYIVELIDEAMPGLPDAIQNRGEELGRITQPIAAAIKAKILATAASPMFNGNNFYSSWVNEEGEPYINPQFDPQKWERAARACDTAIMLAESGGHSLYYYPGSSIFDLSDSTILKMSIRGSVSEKWNPEVIWGSANPTAATLQNWSFTRIDPSARAEILEQVQSYWAATYRMAELYYSNNGVPITEDKTYDYNDRLDLITTGDDHQYYLEPGFETVRLHLNREPRFYASLSFDGNLIYGQGRLDDKDQWVVRGKESQVSGQIDAFRYSVTGYLPKKLVNEEDVLSTNYSRETYPWPVMRLADLYLLYAEVLNEVDGPSEKAYEYIDKVRERAGLAGVVESWQEYSTNPEKVNTKDGLREIIHQERLIELAFEGHRFWDLRRWWKLEEKMNTDIKGWSINKKTAEEYYQLRTVGETKFTKKDYLWPISEADIIVNTNLDQAPGW